MHLDKVDYCGKFLIPSISSVEKDIELIETILAKRVLCRHDVKKINKIYRRIEHFEEASNDILKKIVDKVQQLGAENLFGLITTYHLQGFINKELNLEESFSQMWAQARNNPEIIKEMAGYLSCCHSGQKRGKPQNYPSYFQELLENGYIYLYDHLISMRAQGNRMHRLSEVKKISFSHLSHIILETREAIIQKVKNAILDGYDKILFLIGATGAGKSTTLCFLREDEMVQDNFCYKSKKDQSCLIGDDIATSCTFLPTIEKVNDWMIVDFPGFEDTNGPLISLGIEFALKALIKEYHPKILVLESITNFEAAKDLGLLLSRLLLNKEDCLIGITKYSKDPDFIEIKNIEEQQKKEYSKPSQEQFDLMQALQRISQEELEIMGALEYAAEDGYSDDTIKKMEFELTEWRLKKEKIQLKLANIGKETLTELVPVFPETAQKTERRNKIEEKERILVDLIGIKNIFRFDNLADPNLVFSCFQTISEMKPIHSSFENQLNAEYERFISECFENELENQINSNLDCQLILHDFKKFKKTVLETSFISTIFSKTQPEIGRLFHLPEMDLNIVYGFDKKISSDYVNRVIEYVVLALDINLIEKTLEEFKDQVPEEILMNYQKKLSRLQNYILILQKGEPPLSKADSEEKWLSLRNKYQTEIISIKNRFPEINISSKLKISDNSIKYSQHLIQGINGLSKSVNNIYIKKPLLALKVGVEVGVGLVIGVGLVAELGEKIYSLYKSNTSENEKNKFILEVIANDCKALDKIYDLILNLKELEVIIEKNDQINQIFRSVDISSNSIEELASSIIIKINKIRNIYGEEDWDRRVEYLKENFRINIPQKIHSWFLPMCAYLFIEPSISYEIRQEKGLINNVIQFFVDKKPNLSNIFQLDAKGLVTTLGSMYFIIEDPCISVKEGYFSILASWNFSGLEFPKHLINLFSEPLLVNRALNAAAFIAANEKS